jgi:phage/plasmid-associated DNA primase
VWDEALRGTAGEPVTKRSIIHWAQTCAPVKYKEINDENYVQMLSRFVYTYEGKIEHAMIAKVKHAMLRNKFVVATNGVDEKFVWYEFITSGQTMKTGEIYKWRMERNPVNLHLYIVDHLPKIYFEQMQRIKDRKESAEDENMIKYWAKVEKVFKASETRLYDDIFQNKIILQAQYRFYDRTFIDQLDKYPDVIGVGNGILKLGVETRFIAGFHEYKISKYTDVNYKPFDANNPFIATLLRVFHDIFVEDDVFEFAMMHAGTGLDACESANLLWLIVSGGSSGKSTYTKMIMETLTTVFATPGKASLLVGAFEKSNDANSAQMQMRDMRYFYVDEFEKARSVLNTTRVKSVTGGMRQTGREIYEKQTTFKSTCNIVALNNHPFELDSTDWGSLRRLLYYTAKTKFCTDPDPNNPYEKLIDIDVENVYPNSPDYKEAMMSIMVHYREKLMRLYGGRLSRVPIPTIDAETQAFRKKQDTLYRYISEMMVRSPDAPEMTLDRVCMAYIEWMAKINKKAIITIDDARSAFMDSKLMKNISRINDTASVVRGCRLRSNIDEPLGEGETMY